MVAGMDSLGMTKRQYEVLELLRAYIKDHGYSPSLEEIASGVGLKAKSGVVRILRGLEQRGRITMAAGQARSIAIMGEEIDGKRGR